MLEIKNLSYEVQSEDGRLGILRDVSLTVPRGKFVVVTGPNGGGKTTLARAIMGLVTPTAGQILWQGRDVTGLSVTERAKAGISYAFQQPPRFKGLKIGDLLELAAGNRLSHDQQCQYLTRVGLCANDYIDREMDASLSGGEVKRVEIATVLARRAPLMIFDEPEAGIDLWSFSQLTRTFKALHEEGDATLIVISHQERIIDLADEIVLVSKGKVAAQGPKADILPQLMADTVAGCSYMREGGN